MAQTASARLAGWLTTTSQAAEGDNRQARLLRVREPPFGAVWQMPTVNA
jgi:hypothetical protein